LLVKDGTGRFWDVRRGFGNLGDWNLTQGYQVLVAQPSSIEVHGLEVPFDMPIRLGFGWSIIPYLPREPMPVRDALASLAGVQVGPHEQVLFH